MPVIRKSLILALVCGFALPPLFAQGPARPSPAQQALENRQRRLDHLSRNQPGPSSAPAANGMNTGIPGLDKPGKPGAQANRGRIPATIRERRDAVLSRRFSQRDEHQALRERIERPSRGRPVHAMSVRRDVGENVTERPGVRQSQFVSHGRNRRAYTQADRLLAQRLAQIDRLRDQYLETGDSQLLEQADRLEHRARERYEFRLDGREPPSETIPAQPAAPMPFSADSDAGELPTPAGPGMP